MRKSPAEESSPVSKPEKDICEASSDIDVVEEDELTSNDCFQSTEELATMFFLDTVPLEESIYKKNKQVFKVRDIPH